MKLQNRINIKDTLSEYLSKSVIYIVFICIIAVFSFVAPNFLTLRNFANVARQVSFNGIIALGLSFVIASDGIDISVGSVVGLCGVITATFYVTTSRFLLPFGLAVAISLLAALAIGAINGLIITKGKVAPFIMTMATQTAVRGLALLLANGRPVTSYASKAFNNLGSGTIGPIPIPVIIFAAIILLSYFLLYRIRLGRYFLAVGGNAPAANAAGIKVDRVKLTAYIICALYAGLAGIILAGRVNSALPNTGDGYELDAIAACVIGGTSMSGGKTNVFGTVIGAFIIGFISTGMDMVNISSYYQKIIKGLIIVVAVLLDQFGNKNRS